MTTGNHEGEVGMTSQRVSGTAVQRTIAVLGSAVFFVVAPSTLAGLVPWSITGWQLRPPFLGLELTRGIGAIMILAGVPGLVDAFARFALQGLGTPAPIAPTRNLVVTGLYRYVRNPIYVAVVAIILGQAVLMGDWGLIVYGALLWLFFHVFVVAYDDLTAMDEPAGSSSTAASEQTCDAAIATWVRLLTPSLRMISRTWTFTVVSVMPSLRPITLLGSPWQRQTRTAYCRSVNSGASRAPLKPW